MYSRSESCFGSGISPCVCWCVGSVDPSGATWEDSAGIPTDSAVPYLKWIDGHKSLFKVNLSLVSSIHPQVRGGDSQNWETTSGPVKTCNSRTATY